jgi:hypothetical protein
LSVKDAHPFGNIRHAAQIEQTQKKTVQNGQDARGSAFADLAMIFAQGDISSMVKPIFNCPVLSLQAEKILSRGASGREIGQAMDDFLMRFSFSLNGSAESKHLGDAGPGGNQKVVEFRGRHQFTPFEPSVSFVAGLRRSPISAISGRFALKRDANLLARSADSLWP